MNGKSKPYAILVFGAPLCGKTTFARQFSERFNVPFVNLLELKERFKISRKLGLVIVKEIAKCKQNIIVEGALDTERQREEMRTLLKTAGYMPILVWVQTDQVAIKHRLRAKFKKPSEAKAFLDSAYKNIEAPAESEMPLVISGKHTFRTQCSNVLAGLSERSSKQR